MFVLELLLSLIGMLRFSLLFNAVFFRDEVIHWATPLELYPRMVKSLVLPEYRFESLTGFILAAGGLTESLVCKLVLIKFPNSSTHFW